MSVTKEPGQVMTESGEASVYDILIVGGGMAGAALGCALGQAEMALRVGLVDPDPFAGGPLTSSDSRLDSFDLRVSALTKASEGFLRTLGVWSAMEDARVCPYSGMCVWDAEGTGNIEFNSADLYEASLGHIVENRVTMSALWARLRQLPVEIIQGKVASFRRVGDASLIGLADGHSLKARLVVAADGAESPLRRMAGFATREWDYQQQAIVATLSTEVEHQKTAWQRFLPTGPLAFLPLDSAGADHFSSIVWSTTPEQARILLNQAPEEFCQTLGEAFEFRLGRIRQVSRRAAFPLRQRHAKSYIQPGIVLVADAAHTIHPLAGQGINLGFLDVAVLADELLRAGERGIDFASMAVLQRYQRRRIGHNLGMMAAMEGFKRMFGADPLPLRWLRNTGMRWLNVQSVLKNQIAAMAMGRDLLPERWQPTRLDPYRRNTLDRVS